MSLYLGENLISGVATPIQGARNIGQIIQSTIPLTDAGLHLLDGSVISGDGVYADFVTYIAGLVSTYPDLFVSENNWQTAVTTYGVCGKFVYDSTNNTVRLPKITGFTEGTIDVTALGDYIQAGLPNITGNISANRGWGRDGLGATGAFQASGSAAMSDTINGYNNANNVTFDASRSSSIYGNSDTVQPQSIKVLYYIVIATSTKTDIEVDIDDIVTDLNGKVSKSGDTMSGSLILPRIGCNGNGANNNFDFFHSSKSGGWYLNADRLPNDNSWYEIMPLKEVYSNGTSWYRVWADGWCEQGGVSAKNLQTIQLLKAYANTDYIVFGNILTTDAQQVYGNQINIMTKTTTNFSFPNSSGAQRQWHACGYIS